MAKEPSAARGPRGKSRTERGSVAQDPVSPLASQKPIMEEIKMGECKSQPGLPRGN